MCCYVIGQRGASESELKMCTALTELPAHIQRMLRCPPQKRLSVEDLAAVHGITLPNAAQLPESYTMRMWLTRRLATIQGKHKQVWQNIKANPEKAQRAREATRIRVQKYRQRQRELDTREPYQH